MSHRCTGACCQDIGLHVSPTALRKSYVAWLRQKPRRKGKGDPPAYWDVWLLYPMLVFLWKDRVHPAAPPGLRSRRVVYHYRCKHQDEDTGDCTIYAIRPALCRVHGTDYICRYPNCEWGIQVEARAEFDRLKRTHGKTCGRRFEKVALETARRRRAR